MRLFVTVKRLGKKRALLTEIPYDIPPPATLRDLITSMVQVEASAYNAKPEAGPDGADHAPPPLAFLLTSEDLDAKTPTGKIDFGLRRNRRADLPEAISHALTAFGDGMFRVFVGDVELENLDQPASLHEGDKLTFIRLTMLSGR